MEKSNLTFVEYQFETVFCVSRKLCVAAYEREIFRYGVRDDHAVERVGMIFEIRQVGEMSQVFFLYVFYLKVRFVVYEVNDIISGFPLRDVNALALLQGDRLFYTLGGNENLMFVTVENAFNVS